MAMSLKKKSPINKSFCIIDPKKFSVNKKVENNSDWFPWTCLQENCIEWPLQSHGKKLYQENHQCVAINTNTKTFKSWSTRWNVHIPRISAVFCMKLNPTANCWPIVICSKWHIYKYKIINIHDNNIIKIRHT